MDLNWILQRDDSSEGRFSLSILMRKKLFEKYGSTPSESGCANSIRMILQNEPSAQQLRRERFVQRVVQLP